MARRLLLRLADSTRETPVSDRSKYRDNDDARDFQQDRSGSKPDTKAEARGDAREAIGNHSRDTAANPTGPEGNDRQVGAPRRDQFDDDLDNNLDRNNRSRTFDNNEISES
jgi:hypothetical protein